MTAANQSVTFGNYLRFVQNASPGVSHEFFSSLHDRVQRAYDMGETIEMIAEEIRLRFSLRRPARTKTPLALASRVVAVR